MKVIVLDTGIAHVDDLPDLVLQHSVKDHDRWEFADENHDDLLDPASGHGTFIAGIVEQIIGGVEVQVHRVLSTMGDGYVSDIAFKLEELLNDNEFGERTILNLSFGTYADADLHLLGRAISAVQEAGTVVVASAGNDGLCAPQAPAAFPDVVGVASIDANGGAPYSNHGPWIRACAPGSDVVSSFFRKFDGAERGSPDPDDFENWARWSGTSFAAPIVAGALAHHLAFNTQASARDAVAAVIDAPHLYRVPNYGTVVNLSLS